MPINFEQNRLDNIIEYLRNTTGARILVDWEQLASANVSRSAPITMSLRAVPVGKILRLILARAGASIAVAPPLIINGEEVDRATIGGGDSVGVTETVYANIASGDVVDLALSPEGVGGDRADGADGSRDGEVAGRW